MLILIKSEIITLNFQKKEPVSEFKKGDTIQRANPDGSLVGLPFIADDLDTSFQDGRFVKVSKPVSVSVEEAANDCLDIPELEREDVDYTRIEFFKRGAEWQKEQDKAIILELLEAAKLNEHGFEESGWGFNVEHRKVLQSAITKAETYLNKTT